MRETRTHSEKKAPINPKKKLELNNKNIVIRIIFVILFFVLSLLFLGLGVKQCTSAKEGWNVIQSVSRDMNVSRELTFRYYCGLNGDANNENRLVTNKYTEICDTLYNEFNEYEDSLEGNIYYINHHPNEEIKVSSNLFNVLKSMVENNGRYLYFGNIFHYYSSLCVENNMTDISPFNPNENEYSKSLIEEYLLYANDESKVNLELLENSHIRLNVSNDYLEYSQEKSLSNYIGLGFFRNAYIIDIISREFITSGYTNGTITSDDGYSVFFGNLEQKYSLFKYMESTKKAYSDEQLKFDSRVNIVALYGFELEENSSYYHLNSDGTYISSYISRKGMTNSSVDALISFSSKETCSSILSRIISVYTADELNTELLDNLKNNEIYSLYLKNGNYINYSNLEILS